MTQTRFGKTTFQRGQWAEDQALTFLQSRGLELRARNVRYRCGELDLIMTDGQALVFVEVRYRARTDYGGASGSVDLRKRRRLTRAAMLWLQGRPGPAPPCRFDMVLMSPTEMNWIRGAFLAGGLL
jgi:putative endonuclease